MLLSAVTRRIAARVPASPTFQRCQRLSSSSYPPELETDGEKQVYDKLRTALDPNELVVKDMSGGCGTLYGIKIASPKFKGLTTLKQHRMVNEVLKDDIKTWHGICALASFCRGGG
ncbi:hypothetical protein RI367_002791 [Sorochytrium milnesiophthora]